MIQIMAIGFANLKCELVTTDPTNERAHGSLTIAIISFGLTEIVLALSSPYDPSKHWLLCLKMSQVGYPIAGRTTTSPTEQKLADFSHTTLSFVFFYLREAGRYGFELAVFFGSYLRQ